MDRNIVLLVLSSLFIYNVDGQSWQNKFSKWRSYGDRGVIFEISGGSSEDRDHVSERRRFNYKQLQNWDPDRIWFPDFDEKNFSTGSPSSIKVTTPSFSGNVNECIRQCPKTSEYNPVCGTNMVTYSNMGQLECARSCGVDVRVLRKLHCSLVFQEPTPTNATQTLEDEQRRCIKACPTTPEYNPVCGTNNVTYQNRGGLECAKVCGVDVDVKRLSPCPRPMSPESPGVLPVRIYPIQIKRHLAQTTSSYRRLCHPKSQT